MKMDLVLKKYLEEKNPPIIEKKKNTYLMHNGVLGKYIHILQSGVVKSSMILRDGREFNISYLRHPDIVAIMKDEASESTPAPFNIRIESDVAYFYQIPRQDFWRDVNSNSDMLHYIKDYYRNLLSRQTDHMKMMVMNGKVGALYFMLISLVEQFGISHEEGILIDFVVTNDELAGFCGISSDTSVSRMMKDLREQKVLRMENRKFLILNIQHLRDNVVY